MQTLWGGILAAIAWFFAGGLVYMNPFVARLYKDAESLGIMKKWENVPRYLGLMFLIVLVETLIFAFVYSTIKEVFSGAWWQKGLSFALILIGISVVRRFLDIWIQTTYPNNLLMVELANGIIGSLVVGLVLGFVIR